jgi:uncharacterized protein YjbI with pentapeptide repeats
MGLKSGGDTVETQPHSWWQKRKQDWVAIGGMAIVLIGVLAFIFASYWFHWSWTGFSTRNLWDWLQLLFVPILLAIGGYWLNQIQKDREQRAIDERAEREKREVAERAEREKRETEQRDKTEREIATDNQREAALQAYIDSMSELLLEKKLRESGENDEVRTIARVRTLTVLPRLDGRRKASVVQFLHESHLLTRDKDNKSIIVLNGAKIGKADLRWIHLENDTLAGVLGGEADLREANLSGAHLSGAHLEGANLSGAHLSGARIHNAYLQGTNLTGTDLSGASLWGTNFQGAKYNKKEMQEKDEEGKLVTIKPTQWPQEFYPETEGATCVDC